jgi:hypothetical protein
MSNVDHGPRRLLDVAFFTAAAFIVGGFIQRFLVAELAPAGAAPHSLAPWVLAPVLMQGAVGYLGLAWILRDRFPLILLWTAGMLGLTTATLLVAIALPWSVDPAAAQPLLEQGDLGGIVALIVAPGVLGLVTGLVMSGIMQTGASATVKLGLVYSTGFFAAEVARIVAVIGFILVVVYASWLLPESITMGTLWTIGAVLRDFAVGAFAALGVAWALGRSTLPDGSTVHYVLTKPPSRRTPAAMR